MSAELRPLLQAAASASGRRVGDPYWRPDLNDLQALYLAQEIGALVSFDVVGQTATATHKASRMAATESTVDDRSRAMRSAILRLAASLGPHN